MTLMKLFRCKFGDLYVAKENMGCCLTHLNVGVVLEEK